MKNPLVFLREIAMFRKLSDQELFDIVRICKRTSYGKEQVVCREGDIGTSMFIIEQGQVTVSKRLFNGKEVILATLGSGTVIGEMALIDPSPRSATVKTIADTIIYEVKREDFNLLKTNNLLAPYKVLREISVTLCQRLRETEMKLDNIMKKMDSIFVDEGASEQEQEVARQMGRDLGRRLEKRQ